MRPEVKDSLFLSLTHTQLKIYAEAEKMEDQEGGGEAANDDSVMASWLTVDEQTTTELSNLLESYGTAPPPVKVRFIDNPYDSAVVFQSSSAYVTINGNEESCGSSFSDSDSSVMASIYVECSRRTAGSAWAWEVGETRDWFAEASADVDFGWDGFLIDGGGFDSDDGGGSGGDSEQWWKFLGDDVLLKKTN